MQGNNQQQQALARTGIVALLLVLRAGEGVKLYLGAPARACLLNLGRCGRETLRAEGWEQDFGKALSRITVQRGD